ncbi:hypothetical protein B566_EDAN004759 [Ephemera danica]|nr:hypothetical protein B566_EDAN004759 [Ephemera danica]
MLCFCQLLFTKQEGKYKIITSQMSSEGGIENGTRFKPKKRKVLPGNGGRNCCVCRRNDQVNRDLTFHSYRSQ